MTLVTVQIPEEYLENLKMTAEKESWSDRMEADEEVYVDDFAGGNIDDAYFGGFRAGEIDKAREVLSQIIFPMGKS